MKSKVTVLAVILGFIFGGYWIGTGFMQRTDVALVDYSVTEDGTEMTFHAGVSGSMGYIRGFKDHGGGVKPHYLTFHSTFGGLNSKFGSENEFVLRLSPDDSEIYFNRPDKGYELVLIKDENNDQWHRP